MCKESKVFIDQLTQNSKFLKSYIELCENEFFFSSTKNLVLSKVASKTDQVSIKKIHIC